MDEVIATMHPHTPPRTLPLPLTLPPPNQVIAAIDGHEHKTVETVVVNTDRATGARIAGAVAKKHGNRGWRGSLHVIFTGCAGQSFGAFCLDGLDLEVRGDANDYVGKSLHGGRIRIVTNDEVGFVPTECSITSLE